MHAGDVEDACYYSMVERRLAEHDEYRKAGVLCWFRFRDDMLFMVSSATGFLDLKDRMDKMAGFFELKIEEISADSMRFSDMVVYRDNDGIGCKPF